MTMKRIILSLILIAMIPMLVVAERVDPEVARKVATQFLHNNGVKEVQLNDLSKAAGFSNLYIFTTEKSFVVMAADNCVKPILGYSLTGKFVAEGMPDNVRDWLQGYNDEIQHAIDKQMKANVEVSYQWNELAAGKSNVAKMTEVVSALISTTWNQNSPYNNLCPSGCLTGCVATAMAQIMKYWEYPSTGIGYHSYTWNTHTLSANFGETTYDWHNMPIELNSNSYNDEKQAVATLMYHCGISVDMNYGGVSLANTNAVVSALKSYFNYSDDLQYISRSSIDSTWIAMLKEDLDNHRPILYRGSSGSNGHAFVCDGYNSDNYFHFNFGWNGNSDGYYSIYTGLDGANGPLNYTKNQEAVFGIHPSECTLGTPVNLVYTLDERNITLNWDTVSGAVSYNIYRNNNYVGNTNTNTYTETVPFGTNIYFIRCVDSNGKLSFSSNTISVTLNYQSAPVVDDLTLDYSKGNATLSWTTPDWCYPENASAILTYDNGFMDKTTGGQGYYHLYWGHRYPKATIQEESMKLYKVSFYALIEGNYHCLVYQGTSNNGSPTTQLADIPFTTSIRGWFDINIEPIDIDGSQDLWVFIYDPDFKDFPIAVNNTINNEGDYYFVSENNIQHFTNGVWLIRSYLTSDTYTYNLYDNGISVESNYATTNFILSSPNSNTAHCYTVKTNYCESETVASNMAGLTLGTAELSSLELDSNDKMTVTEGSTLTVTGTLSNNKAANLVLENDAQLIHSSDNVAATVQKSITAYHTGDAYTGQGKTDGWYTIASPVKGNYSTDGLTTDTFDLYLYHEPTHYWWNSKGETEHSFDSLSNGHGYLYANSVNQTLAFEGNMLATNTTVTVPLSCEASGVFRGYNLVGNPFSRNLTSSDVIKIGDDALTSYYYVEGGTELVPALINNRPIKPVEGFFVQTSTEANLVFNEVTRSNGYEKKQQTAFISIEAGNDSFMDRVYIQRGKGNTLHKMSINDNVPHLSVLYNNDNFAVATIEVAQGELPLNFKAVDNGTHTISINTMGLDLNYLHLIDNITGVDINLLQQSSYSFEAKTTDYASRFKLVFSICEDKEGYNEDFAFFNGSEWVIIDEYDDATLQLVDITGRIVINRNAKSCVSTNGVVPGVYVMRLINGNTVKTQKIVVR